MEVAHGNRGKCAQACRLPYTLYQDQKSIDKGYLLSPKDICALPYLAKLQEIGVNSFKIEGRMKSPEYVATVTRIYHQWMHENRKEFEKKDRKELAQVFNRGGFSNGHLAAEPNHELVYPVKPNHMGLLIGKVEKINEKKSYITTTPQEELSIGDSLMIGKNEYKYTISELLQHHQNVKKAFQKPTEIGRVKGDVHVGDKIYRIRSKELSTLAQNSYAKEFKKTGVTVNLQIHQGVPIQGKISITQKPEIFFETSFDILPEPAISYALTSDKIHAQFSKTGNTAFHLDALQVDLEDGICIPAISRLNEMRRTLLAGLEQVILQSSKRKPRPFTLPTLPKENSTPAVTEEIALLLAICHPDYDYTKLSGYNAIYIPFHYYCNTAYQKCIRSFSSTYVYLPSIIKDTKRDFIQKQLDTIVHQFSIDGFVISNLADLSLVQKYHKKIIGNYTLNVFNNYTVATLKKLGLHQVMISPELGQKELQTFSPDQTSFLVYGNLPVMVLNYCPLGKSNHCYANCCHACQTASKFYLKDRMGLDFRILPDPSQTITTIYNSKTTSISKLDIPFHTYRIDLLDEDIASIQTILNVLKAGKKLSGNQYTNGNLRKEV